jgi:hypothetical protein
MQQSQFFTYGRYVRVASWEEADEAFNGFKRDQKELKRTIVSIIVSRPKHIPKSDHVPSGLTTSSGESDGKPQIDSGPKVFDLGRSRLANETTETAKTTRVETSKEGFSGASARPRPIVEFKVDAAGEPGPDTGNARSPRSISARVVWRVRHVTSLIFSRLSRIVGWLSRPFR